METGFTGFDESTATERPPEPATTNNVNREASPPPNNPSDQNLSDVAPSGEEPERPSTPEPVDQLVSETNTKVDMEDATTAIPGEDNGSSGEEPQHQSIQETTDSPPSTATTGSDNRNLPVEVIKIPISIIERELLGRGKDDLVANDLHTMEGLKVVGSKSLSKNKEIVEEFTNGQQVVTLHPDRGISDMPESEEGWRAYYDHPLNASSVTMINNNANNQNNEEQNNSVGLFYELYKLPPMEKGIEKALAEKIYGQEIWNTGVTSANGVRGVLTSVASSASDRNPSSATLVSASEAGGATSSPKPVVNVSTAAHDLVQAASPEDSASATSSSATVLQTATGPDTADHDSNNNNNNNHQQQGETRVLTQSEVDLYLNRAAAAAAKREQQEIDLRQRLVSSQSSDGHGVSTRNSPSCVVIVNNPDSPDQHHVRQQLHEVNGIGSAVIIAPGGVISQGGGSPVILSGGSAGHHSPSDLSGTRLSPVDLISHHHHHHPSVLGQTVLVIKQETNSPLNVSRLPSPCSPNSTGGLTPPAQDHTTGIKSEALQLTSSPCHTPVDLVSVTAPLAPSAVAVTGSPLSGPLGSPDSGKSNDMNGNGSQGSTVISLSAAAAQPFPTQVFANISGNATYETLGMAQYNVLTNAAVAVAAAAGAPPQYGAQTTSTTSSRTAPSSVYTLTPSDYYRDYYSPSTTPTDQYQTVRQHLATYGDGNDSSAFVDRYIRQNGTAYKSGLHGLSVDLPSPDSGIGEATITPRDNAGLSQIFDYSELSQTQITLQGGPDQQQQAGTPSPGGTRTPSSQAARRSWHEFGRNSESDKVQIPKLHSDVGFKYFLESPISTSQRREDDRITYINKGQFYGITLEYLPDPEKSLKSPTVKSVVMLVFREEKTTEEEIKAWQFWHSRQHSVKQRILDADTKNSSGIIGQIEEVTHNAIAFYWNPLESQAKINIAVQCLSTDFSNQKGVKGLPLHLQIDTFDDYREGSTPVHRGYCQIKVFCDKGAERKTRDEERRAAKRKLTATGSGRKKMEEMYHPPMDRSEFYSMSDLQKPPILFTPSEDLEKKDISTVSQQMAGMELSFYNQPATTPTTPEENGLDRREKIDPSANTIDLSFAQPPTKRLKTYPNDRDSLYLLPPVLLYAKRDSEEVFHALHLVPPTLAGLANAIESKYDIGTNSIRSIYKRCSKGITVQMDDDIVKHYCNEDTFIIEIIKTEEDLYDITLVEL